MKPAFVCDVKTRARLKARVWVPEGSGLNRCIRPETKVTCSKPVSYCDSKGTSRTIKGLGSCDKPAELRGNVP